MELRLNLFLKNFGNNSTPHVTFFCKDAQEVQKLIINYKPVLKNYSIYKYEYENEGNVFITRQTEIKGVNILNLLPDNN